MIKEAPPSRSTNAAKAKAETGFAFALRRFDVRCERLLRVTV
jgi:hypothetical protein